MIIENNNILIRKFKYEDIEAKVRIINDEKNNRFLHYDLPLEYNKTVNWFKNNINNNKRCDFTIEYYKKIAGFIGLLNLDEKNAKAEYYICVDNLFAFNKINLNKVYLYTEVSNIKAQLLFEKIGFKKEGLLKDDLIYSGKKICRYVYGMCKDDFYE